MSWLTAISVSISVSTLFYILYAVLIRPAPFYWSCPPYCRSPSPKPPPKQATPAASTTLTGCRVTGSHCQQGAFTLLRSQTAWFGGGEPTKTRMTVAASGTSLAPLPQCPCAEGRGGVSATPAEAHLLPTGKGQNLGAKVGPGSGGFGHGCRWKHNWGHKRSGNRGWGRGAVRATRSPAAAGAPQPAGPATGGQRARGAPHRSGRRPCRAPGRRRRP